MIVEKIEVDSSKKAERLSELDSVKKNRVLSNALLRVQKKLKLSNEEFFKIANVSPVRASRIRKENEGSYIDVDSKDGELAVAVIELYKRLASLCNDDSDLMYSWLHGKNKAFNDQPPIEEIKTMEGLFNVNGYLDSFRGQQSL